MNKIKDVKRNTLIETFSHFVMKIIVYLEKKFQTFSNISILIAIRRRSVKLFAIDIFRNFLSFTHLINNL